MAEILFKELSYAVVGAAMEVHRTLGPGYLEAVYQAALAHEMALRGVHFAQYCKLPVQYKGLLIGNYEADFVVSGCMILELKAAACLHPKHEAQAVHYLVATGLELAILLNFGADSLERKRVVRLKSFGR